MPIFALVRSVMAAQNLFYTETGLVGRAVPLKHQQIIGQSFFRYNTYAVVCYFFTLLIL